MAILALATSGPHGEVALAMEGGRVRAAALGTGAARGRGLLAAVRALLEAEALGVEALRAVAVDTGPGSFTGTRVGVTAAKTLAWARGIPIHGVSSLAALARAAPPDRAVLAIRDAGRGSLYRAAYGPLEGDRRPVLVPPAREAAAAALSHLGRRLAVGEEAVALLARAGRTGEARTVRADAAAVLAEARVVPAAAPSPHALVPVYLQASAPERRRREGGREAGGRIDRP